MVNSLFSAIVPLPLLFYAQWHGVRGNPRGKLNVSNSSSFQAGQTHYVMKNPL
jgi:hypothetical protein